jgi:hypothetical protein
MSSSSSSGPTAHDLTIFSGKVTPDWIERGVFLSKAALRCGNPIFAVPARAAAERFKELRDGETTEMFEGSSLLSGAARDRELLNLLHGEEKQAWLDYYTNRNAAERALWFDLGWNGALRAFGANEIPSREPEWIPVQAWYWLHPDPAKKDVVSGEGMKYYYVRVVEPWLHSDHPPSASQPPAVKTCPDLSTAVTPPADETASTRKTGPRPDKKNAAAAAMLNAVTSGELTLGQLMDIPKKELPFRFFQAASESTCFEARKQVCRTLNSD